MLGISLLDENMQERQARGKETVAKKKKEYVPPRRQDLIKMAKKKKKDKCNRA